MRRFHIHISVKNLEKSIQFYSTLFGQQPSKQKSDYAKWMLEEPRINFAISTRAKAIGLDHLGFQVDSEDELNQITERLKKADLGVYGEGESNCCYAKSVKSWVSDPAGIAWETYQSMNDIELFGESKSESNEEKSQSACCVPNEQSPKQSCG